MKINPNHGVVNIRNGDGKQLQFDSEEERDIYFRQLQDTWQC